MSTNDHALLEAALVGYKHQADELAEKIADIQRQLGGKAPSAAPKAAAAAAPRKRRAMSAAARKRIAAAQKKRWAEYHKLKEGKD